MNNKDITVKYGTYRMLASFASGFVLLVILELGDTLFGSLSDFISAFRLSMITVGVIAVYGMYPVIASPEKIAEVESKK